MNKRIYLIITLQVIISERTFYPNSVHIIEVGREQSESEIEEEINRYSLEVAKGYTDNLDEDYGDSETFFFNCEELSTEVFTVNRITQSEYETLNKYIN